MTVHPSIRVLVLLILVSIPARAQPDEHWTRPLTRGGVEASIAVLNHYQQQPENVNELYSKAYELLAADKKATYRVLAED